MTRFSTRAHGLGRFITIRTQQQLPLLTCEASRQEVALAIEECQLFHGFLLMAWAIMPTHTHLVVFPLVDTGPEEIVEKFREISERRLTDIIKADSHRTALLGMTIPNTVAGKVWQQSFEEEVCDTFDGLWRRISYCHHDAVHHGLVQRADEWPFSSARWYNGQRETLLTLLPHDTD